MLSGPLSLENIIAWSRNQPETDLSILPTKVHGHNVKLYRNMYELIRYVRLADCPDQGDLYRTLYNHVLTDKPIKGSLLCSV